MLQSTPAEKLNHMASDALHAEGATSFMQPGTKKRGRPKKVDEGPSSIGSGGPKPIIDPIGEWKPVTSALTEFYSNGLVMYAEDQRAALTDDVKTQLRDSSAICAHQFMPDGFGKYGALASVLLIISTTGFNAWILRRENLAKLMEEKRARTDAMKEMRAN